MFVSFAYTLLHFSLWRTGYSKHHCLSVNNPSLYFVKDWD